MDTWILGWRLRDLNTAYNSFLAGRGITNVFSDPYFIAEYCEGKDPRRPDADAERALCTQEQTARIDGIVVSNHGGRQVDGALASFDALAPIAALCRSRNKTCIFDSGIRTCSDVIKALALGSHAVDIGRPWAWGLALEGQEGVSKVLKSILADMELNAVLAGCKSVRDICHHMLVRSHRGCERL